MNKAAAARNNKPPKLASVGCVALTAVLVPGSKEAQLTPVGQFRASDGSGRPNDIEGGRPWFIDSAVAARVMARAAVRQNRFVIDYEHQTIMAAQNGKPAPAAGWWLGTEMEWREGVGLFATNVEWTATAAAHIAAKEYAYISAVFDYDKQTGEVLALRHAALTNDPGLDGMAPVAALSAMQGAGPWIDPCGDAANTPQDHPEESEKGKTMELLKKLLAALGLPETTSEENAVTAVAALKAKTDATATELAALKAAAPAGAVDLTKYVPVEVVDGLRANMAALTAQGGSDADALVEKAKADGKVWPAEVDYLKSVGKTSGLAVLKAQLDARPVVPALVGLQSQAALTAQHSQQQQGGANAITTEGLAVCKALGLTPEEFLGQPATAKK